MSECKNRFGTRATRRANPVTPKAKAKASPRSRPTLGDAARAVWVRFTKTSRAGTVTNHAKLVTPGRRKV
jgi:hypothetical protein